MKETTYPIDRQQSERESRKAISDLSVAFEVHAD
jgi:hypothetical protein